jgi:hypothetical protein
MRINSASISARGITGNAAPARFHDLRVRVFNRRRNHHHRRIAGNVLFEMPDKNLRAESGQAPSSVASLQVGTAHGIARIKQHFGDTAHADATDTDEMNFMFLLQHGASACNVSMP